MSEGLNSLDLKFVVRELRESLLGGRFRKIYQYGDGRFLFDIYLSTKGGFLLHADMGSIFLAQGKQPAPQTPPDFCMLLRKYLIGARIKDIRQVGFDRIVEIETDNNIIVFEMMPPGNIVICDSFRKIIMPLKVKRFSDREIVPKKEYRHPPARKNPFNISTESFAELVRGSPENIGNFLTSMGFGRAYAEEICFLAGADTQIPNHDLSEDAIGTIFRVIRETGARRPDPVTYEDGSVFLFPMKTVKGQIKARWSGLSPALSELYLNEGDEPEMPLREETPDENKEVHMIQKEPEKEEESAEEKVAFDKEPEEKEMPQEPSPEDKKQETLKRIISRQEEAAGKMKEKRTTQKERADLIYRFYGTVEDVINGIQRARDSGMGWTEIKERAENEPTPEAEAIEEIREHEGRVLVNLGGKQVEIDFTKSVEENAEDYYEDSKRAKKKMEGAEKAMQEKKQELETSGHEEEKPAEKPKPKKRKPRKRWYEKFRWFISSKGFLIVAGKDAKTNDKLIKKHTDPKDIVFHADIAGAAFVVAKGKGTRGTKFTSLKGDDLMPLEVKKEASEIAAACSKAWQKGLANIDVQGFRPEQLKKTAADGTNLPKGSFHVDGEKELFKDVEIKLSFGVLMDKKEGRAEVIAGPVMAMRTFSKYFVTIKPGETPASELSKQIKEKLVYKSNPDERPIVEQIDSAEIERLIPSGSGMIFG